MKLALSTLTMLWLASAMLQPVPAEDLAERRTAPRLEGRFRYDPAGQSLSRPSLRGKSPVVFFHGLWARPASWRGMIEALAADPAIDDRFQFWTPAAARWASRETRTPPSRFVRIAAMRHFAMTPQDAEGGMILAEHLLDGAAIPRGLELVQCEVSVRSNLTHWSVIKDLHNRVLYFRGYDSHAFRAIHLLKLDFGPHANRLSSPIPAGGGIIDVTGNLKH